MRRYCRYGDANYLAPSSDMHRSPCLILALSGRYDAGTDVSPGGRLNIRPDRRFTIAEILLGAT